MNTLFKIQPIDESRRFLTNNFKPGDSLSIVYIITLGSRDFSSAVSGFCQVFIVTRAFFFCLMYRDRDTFDFSQGHVTKNQPMAVPV